MPTLIDGDDCVFDSAIIMQYLENEYQAWRARRPTPPGQRARARQIEDVVQTTIGVVL